MEPIPAHPLARPRPVRPAEIHPTAVVDPAAQLGHNVRIGPYCVIGPDVVIGPDCILESNVLLTGHVVLGRNNHLYHGAVLGTPPQDLKYKQERSWVEVGDDNIIREYATIHLATGEDERTRVGDGNMLMTYVHIAHNCHIHNRVIIGGGSGLAGHVEVEDHAIIGGMTPVHQFVRIGQHSFVGGGSRLPQDVPPFFRVAGNPVEVAGINAVGLRRRGFPDQELLNIKKAYRLIYRSGLNVTQALERIAQECELTPSIEDLMAFIRRSERGIVR